MQQPRGRITCCGQASARAFRSELSSDWSRQIGPLSVLQSETLPLL